jgi:peptidoglycan/xylan/chitin deacetylase (PgdA/CDA1 family)
MARRLSGIPVLMYHGIAALGVGVDVRDRKYWVAASSFRQQLEQLRHTGRRTVGLGTHWGRQRAGDGANDVVLTFDDGRASDYEVAFPLLLEMGARAEFFVNTGTIGQPGHLTWAQIAEMQRAGMSFQSHGHDHIALLPLTRDMLHWQLRTSKQLLEDHLGRAVDFFAAPYGLLGRHVLETAFESGYAAVCNSRHWPAHVGARVVNRVAVHGDTSATQFAGLLEGDLSAYLPGFSLMAAKELPKRMLLRLRPEALGVSLARRRAYAQGGRA